MLTIAQAHDPTTSQSPTAPIDAGLLGVLRVAVWIRLLFTLLIAALLAMLQAPEVRLAIVIMAESTVLLTVLYWGAVRRWLRRTFLPAVLAWALISPLFGRIVLLSGGWQTQAVPSLADWMMPGGSIDNDIFAIAGFNLAWMAVPVVLASWQYGRRGLWLTMTVVTAGSLLAVLLQESSATARLGLVIDLAGRLALIGLVAIVVERLAAAQRHEHAALQAANRELAARAATIEQLTESRERNRLARELHDTLAHTLTGVSVQLQALARLMTSDPLAAQTQLKATQATVRDGVAEARRAIQALRATPLVDLGLSEALRQRCRAYAERLGIAFACQIEEVGVLEPTVEQAIYRVAEAALANIEQHAGATQVTVVLTTTNDAFTLTICDDGVGFDPAQVAADRFGLAGMRERADAIGARLTVQSALGRGTTVTLTLTR